MNYAQLSQLIQDYCETTESSFVANIPTFVQVAEEGIYNTVQLPTIPKNESGNMTAGNHYLSLPDDWLANFSLAVITPVTLAQSYLINKDVNFIRECYPPPNSSGAPQYYAIFDDNTLILGPTPDVSYGVEMHYYYYPESIVTAGTSWLGNNFESVLLYGCLREAYIYQKGESDIATYYENKYLEALNLLKQLGDGKDRRDAYRSGQLRIPVQ